MVDLTLSQKFPGAVAAFPHDNEAARLNELRRLGILDTENESRFDDITQLVASVFESPIAVISLIDSHRQWFKSSHGLNIKETHRDLAFCSHSIHENQILVINDTLLDNRFNTNPLVLNAPNIRFYAGAVIRSNGMPLGTLCIIDSKPREFLPREQSQLLLFSKLVENELASDTRVAQDRTHAQLRADYDPLTHFLTRKAFKTNLDYQLRAQEVRGHSMHLLYLRVENLNRLNLEYGRFLSDCVLAELSRRLKQCLLGYSHIIGRLDVNTFAVNIAYLSESDKTNFTRTLEAEINRIFKFDNISLTISTSIVLQSCEACLSATEIISICEYLTKHSSKRTKNKVLVAHNQLGILHKRTSIRRKLGNAIDAGLLSIHYQPKIDTESKQLAGLEALLRWKDNTIGDVAPLEILEASTELGLNNHLTEWIIHSVCQQMAEWQQQDIKLVPVAINLDEDQLRLPEFPQFVQTTLDKYNLDAHLIEFEITERTFMHDMPSVINNMRALKKSGISFSIDDFGTGYSALSSLYKIPIDTLKIDKSFIDNIQSNVRNYALVKAIISFCRNADLKVIAEGLEHIDQFHILENFRCHQIQGYLFSRPVDSDKAKAMLTSNLAFTANSP